MSKINFNNIDSCWNHLFEKHKILIDNIFERSKEYDIPLYPSENDIFKVFSMNVNDIKILFLGQDPYHSIGQANGLAFSVNDNIKIPPSLQNIYKELRNTYPERNYIFSHGNLERWYKEEKIFLLNCSLSVLEGKPGFFMKDWQPFTDDVIKFISENNKKCVFLLLGNYAKEKIKFITQKDQCILGVHPSPLSANRGFIGSKIFQKIDEKLESKIDWNI